MWMSFYFLKSLSKNVIFFFMATFHDADNQTKLMTPHAGRQDYLEVHFFSHSPSFIAYKS